jgi:ribosomal protein L37E
MKPGEKKCPRCAEAIKVEAKVCKHCGYEFSESMVAGSIAKARDDKRNGAIGCLALIVVSGISVAMCARSGPDAQTEAGERYTPYHVTERGVYGDHLDVAAVVASPTSPTNVIEVIGEAIVHIRTAVAQGEIDGTDRAKSVTIVLRYQKDGREEPLAQFDGQMAELRAADDDTVQAIEALSNVRARHDGGDVLIRHGCELATSEIKVTKLCKSV